MGDKLIAWFKELSKKDIPIVGGKGANLGEMYNHGFPIPPGFCVTSEAFKLFLKETKLGHKIYSLLDGLDVEDSAKLAEASSQIQEMITNAKMPEIIKSYIEESYKNLDVDLDVYKLAGKGALDFIKAGRNYSYVAVRSSATAEDLPEASFAGQQKTFLNIKGVVNVIDAVQQCWASLFTARAIYYRTKNHFPHNKVYIAVVVQKMINSEKAGVAFSINPATNNKEEIMIEAGFGLGEAVVSGSITPNTYIVDKKNYKIKDIKLSEQEWAYYRDVNLERTVKRRLSEKKGKEQVLSEDEIRKLARIIHKIEDHYEVPQDIEWAIEEGRMFIVQSRPVTTAKERIVSDKEKGEEIILSREKEILNGLNASPGVATGIVRILRGPEELYKVQKGDVLVTKMTDPDYVPAMEKAVAIVTDEGGLTCFGGDTKVLTNKGFLEIKEVTERVNNGEDFFIFSFDYNNYQPKWKKILKAGTRKRDAIRISTSQTNKIDHNTLDITSDHKMFTFEGRNLIKKELSKVLECDESLCLVDKLPKNIIELKNDKLAYLMGALLTDGCVRVINHHTGNPRRGVVVFTQKQIPEKFEFINTVQECFKEAFDEEFSLIREKTSNSQIRGRQITGTATDFICSKLAPAQSILKISQNLDLWTLSLSESSTLNFLAGLIDGDGSFYNNRLHIYVSKENVLRGIILACLKLGIVPQVTVNRNIHHVQILEKMNEILGCSKRLKWIENVKINGNKLFAAKQILGDVIDEVNWKGRIKPYIKNNLLIDYNKIKDRVLPLVKKEDLKEELARIMNSDLRMHRVKKINDLGLIDVYNLEVQAENELDHNYVVFTKKYTPLLVSNSHAAIVSREMKIPCIVGTLKATSVLKEGQEVTVDGTTGKVYDGSIKIQHEEQREISKSEIEMARNLKTKTKIYMNLGEPGEIDRYNNLPFDGIGLMRLEFLISDIVKTHPNQMIKENRQDEYIDKLAEGIRKVASAINPKPIIVRFSDFKTNEYRNLEGGSEYEPEEANPMIGWRGVSRYISPEFKEAFKLEIRAIKKVREQLKNVYVMLPFVRTVNEVKDCLELLKEEGCVNGEQGFKVYLMAEVPSMALIAEQFARLNVTGCSIGSNDLTQLVLGIDRDSAILGRLGYFDERNDAVKEALRLIIRGFKKAGKTTGICGQAPSRYPEFVHFLLEEGIDSVSVNPDVVVQVREQIDKVEETELGIHI